MERASWKTIIFSLLYQSFLLVLAHCVTYLFIDASREPDQGNKGDDSGDDEFPNEEQEVGDLVKNCHPYLGRQLSKVILKFSAGCSPYFWISSQKPALRTDRNWFLERRSKCRHSWNIWWTSNLSFKKQTCWWTSWTFPGTRNSIYRCTGLPETKQYRPSNWNEVTP